MEDQQGQAARYSQQLIQVYNPGRSLRSAGRGQQSGVICQVIFKGDAAPIEFPTREPQSSGTKAQFKSNLKTHLLGEHFSDQLWPGCACIELMEHIVQRGV